MEGRWKPAPGQVALIEGGSADDETCLTGVVVGGDEHRLLVDLGSCDRPPAPGVEVFARFFSPLGLYRVSATTTAHEGRSTLVELAVHSVERVQRRDSPRARVALRAVLSDFDSEGEPVSVVGETIDVGPGGCRLRTRKPFPPSCDPTVSLRLPDGHTVSSLAAILQVERNEDEDWEYRLVFMALEDDDAAHLLALAGEPPGGG